MRSKKIITVIMGVISFVWFIPIYFMLINSFKPFKEVVLETAKFPSTFYLGNYIELFKNTNYLQLFFNSIIITSLSVAGIVLLSSMLGYRMARYKNRFSKYLFIYISFAVIIPFQAIMIPLVKVMNSLFLIDTRIGIILVYIAHGLPFGTFLYYSSIVKISELIDQSAKIDGANLIKIYTKIIFPMCSPITVTVVILQFLYIWNDFLLPLIVLKTNTIHTLPLGMSAIIMGEYSNKWNYAMASAFLTSIPMILVFVFLQKYIIKGVAEGSLKI